MSAFKSFTIGIMGDAGAIGSLQSGFGYAMDLRTRDHKTHALYNYHSLGYGLALNASLGIEIGFWKDNPTEMNNSSFWGIEIAANQGTGGSIGFYFKKKVTQFTTELLGFSVVLEAGSGFPVKENITIEGSMTTFTHHAPENPNPEALRSSKLIA